MEGLINIICCCTWQYCFTWTWTWPFLEKVDWCLWILSTGFFSFSTFHFQSFRFYRPPHWHSCQHLHPFSLLHFRVSAIYKIFRWKQNWARRCRLEQNHLKTKVGQGVLFVGDKFYPLCKSVLHRSRPQASWPFLAPVELRVALSSQRCLSHLLCIRT